MSQKNEVCPYPGGIFLRSAQKLIRSLKKILGKEPKDNKCFSISSKINDDLQEVLIDNFHEPSVNLQQIFSGVERFDCLDIYVHGSWADNTKTAFSDLDDLVIVDSDALIDTKEARKIEKMKCFVGSFLLVPAFIFQLKGLRVFTKFFGLYK